MNRPHPGDWPRASEAAEEADVERLERFAELLDSQFRLPGTNVRLGLDPLLGLIPGIGDAATALISLGVVNEARRIGASNRALARMLVNIGVDSIVGTVPLVGDIFDVGYRANRRNVQLLRQDLRRTRARRAT
jgi:hypothetical protein